MNPDAWCQTHGACPAGAGPSPMENPGNPWPGKPDTPALQPAVRADVWLSEGLGSHYVSCGVVQQDPANNIDLGPSSQRPLFRGKLGLKQPIRRPKRCDGFQQGAAQTGLLASDPCLVG